MSRAVPHGPHESPHSHCRRLRSGLAAPQAQKQAEDGRLQGQHGHRSVCSSELPQRPGCQRPALTESGRRVDSGSASSSRTAGGRNVRGCLFRGGPVSVNGCFTNPVSDGSPSLAATVTIRLRREQSAPPRRAVRHATQASHATEAGGRTESPGPQPELSFPPRPASCSPTERSPFEELGVRDPLPHTLVPLRNIPEHL